MTRTKLTSSILFATILVTFATTAISLPVFAQQVPTPNPQGQQVSVQQQLQSAQGQQYASQQQAQQVSPYSSQPSIQSIITQVQPPLIDQFLNQEAVINTDQRNEQFQTTEGGLVALGLQVGNVAVDPNVQVAVPVAANVGICGVAVLGEVTGCTNNGE